MVTYRADVMFINIKNPATTMFRYKKVLLFLSSRYYNGPVLQMIITLNTYYYNNPILQSAKE